VSARREGVELGACAPTTADRSTGSSDLRRSAFQRLLKAALPGLVGRFFVWRWQLEETALPALGERGGGRAAVCETAARGWVNERRNQNVTRCLSGVLTKRGIKLAE
jgi:hypothetical protein